MTVMSAQWGVETFGFLRPLCVEHLVRFFELGANHFCALNEVLSNLVQQKIPLIPVKKKRIAHRKEKQKNVIC